MKVLVLGHEDEPIRRRPRPYRLVASSAEAERERMHGAWVEISEVAG